MSIRHMLIFRTVCEMEFNMTKAAEKLHMTQPAVSLAIKELEAHYDVKLFDRIGRRLMITEVGQYFLQNTNQILNLFNDMENGLYDWKNQGSLRIGASLTIGTQLLPEYVKEFIIQHPRIDVHVMVEPSNNIEAKIIKNEIDFALIEGIPHHPALESEAYMDDYLSVICPIDSKWKQDEEIGLEEFVSQRFILREPGSGTREVFDLAMNEVGVVITPSWEAMSTGSLVNAVINGLGIAVLPERMVQTIIKERKVKSIKVRQLSFHRHFRIIYHKDKYLSEAAHHFIDLVRLFSH